MNDTQQRETTGQVVTLTPSRLPLAASIAKEYGLAAPEWRVLVEQIFPAAKSVEAVMMALTYCRKRNLDIFKKPVHIVPMWSTAKKDYVETVWPGIAEIRTTATRTGQYAGLDEVEFGPIVERNFEGVMTKWENRQKTEAKVTKTVAYPEWAKVTVYRMVHGVRCAYTAKIWWEESYATLGNKNELPNDMWAKRPRGQLDKCVEAAALRKAFPEELGSMYAAEEMEGRELDGGPIIEHAAVKVPAPPPPPAETKSAAKVPAPPPAKPVVIDNESTEFDATQFFENLEADLAKAGTVEDVEEAWAARDPESVFDGDEENLDIAIQIRDRRLRDFG